MNNSNKSPLCPDYRRNVLILDIKNRVCVLTHTALTPLQESELCEDLIADLTKLKKIADRAAERVMIDPVLARMN
jgi:hypothetical protein